MATNIAALVRRVFDDPDDDLPSQPNVRWLQNDLKKLVSPDEGPNFLASQCLLTGLEFVARFNMHRLPGEVSLPPTIATIPYKKLDLFRRGHKHSRSDTAAALTFIKDYFPVAYQDAMPGCVSTTKAYAIWQCFRHGHVHGYVQKRIVLPSGKTVIGQVSWRGTRHLQVYSRPGYPRIFQLSVRQLQADLYAAIHRFRASLLNRSNAELRKRFVVAYEVWKRPVPLK